MPHDLGQRRVRDPRDPRRAGADPATGATIVPIYATSTFTQEAPGQHKGFEYSRSGNPTRSAPGDLPGGAGRRRARPGLRLGPGGHTAVLSTLRPGDEVAAAADLYGGTFRLLERVFKPWGLVPRYTEDPTPEGFAAISRRPRSSIWIETPTNPLLQIIDIAAVAELAHRHGALLAVDNTFASPYLQRPLEHGRRPRGPQHDQISRRPLRRDRRRRDRPPRDCSSRSRSTRTPPAASRAVRRLADPARDQDPGRPHGAALRERRAARRLAGRRIRRWSGSTIPGSPDHPGHASPRGRCATSAG